MEALDVHDSIQVEVHAIRSIGDIGLLATNRAGAMIGSNRLLLLTVY